MVKKKTSISIDEYVWRDFCMFVIALRGSTRKIGSEVEVALKKHIQSGGSPFVMEKSVPYYWQPKRGRRG